MKNRSQQDVRDRVGTTAEHVGLVLPSGSITVDSTKNVVVVHDGATPGGHPLAPEGSTPPLGLSQLKRTRVSTDAASLV